MGPRVTILWYIGNSKAKKLLQAYLEQQNFFSIAPMMRALTIGDVCPLTQPHSLGLPFGQKKLFSSYFARTHVCICFKFRTL